MAGSGGKQKEATKDAALQARVSPEFARHFNAIAKARNKSSSELVREAVEKLAAESIADIEAMQEELERKFREEHAALEAAKRSAHQVAKGADG